jgi:hypothetical protein
VIAVPAILLYVAYGAASAAGGWLFHKWFGARRLSAAVDTLDERVSALEKS